MSHARSIYNANYMREKRVKSSNWEIFESIHLIQFCNEMFAHALDFIVVRNYLQLNAIATE